MFTSQVIASVATIKAGTEFKNGKIAKVDKNGKLPRALTVLSGQYPQNRTILSGTIADNLGLEDHKTYLFQVREVEANDHGRQFIYEAPQVVSSMERFEMVSKLGVPVPVNIDNNPASKTEELNVSSEEKFLTK